MKAISMFKREGVISVTVATIVSLFLVISAVQAVTTISTDIATGGALCYGRNHSHWPRINRTGILHAVFRF